MAHKPKVFESSDLADLYVKYRPSYGPEIVDAIINFCKEPGSPGFSLAVDVACGSGQSTLDLTQLFQKVIGVDASEAQISKAPTATPNVSFRVGSAEDLSFLDNGSVDLVTVGTAMHWLDQKRFYPEVERVLKPGGAFVLYCYDLEVLDKPEAQEVIQWSNKAQLTNWNKWLGTHLEDYYRNLPCPFGEWRRPDNIKFEKNMTVDDFVRYLESVSAWHMYLKENPNATIMKDIKRRLQKVYHDGNGEELEMKVIWPVFMQLSRKPQA